MSKEPDNNLIKCPNRKCRRSLRFKPEMTNQKVKCPHCNAEFVMGSPDYEIRGRHEPAPVAKRTIHHSSIQPVERRPSVGNIPIFLHDNEIVGIYLGETTVMIAVIAGCGPTEVSIGTGNKLTPSVVASIPSIIAFDQNGARLFGYVAKNQAIVDPTNTIISIRRFMGRLRNEVGREEKDVFYEITGRPDELVKVKVREKSYTPSEIAAMILKKAKEEAELHDDAYMDFSVKKAVITVPVTSNKNQRQATRTAGELAGLEVLDVIEEPIVAAYAYGLNEIIGVMVNSCVWKN